MTFDQSIERMAKILGVLGDLVKAILIVGLVWIGFVAVTKPETVKDSLKELRDSGVNVDKWEANLPLLKISGTVFNVADAVATAQAKVSAAQEAQPGRSASPELLAVSASLAEVQSAMARHGREIRAVAARAGVVENLPKTGWIYVGYFSTSGARKLSDRVDPRDVRNLKIEGGNLAGLTQLTLKLDAWVAQGDECVRVAVDSVPDATAAAEMLPKIMLESDPAKPLEVLRAAPCKGPGEGSFVWAEVRIPPDRVLAIARK